MERKGHYFSKIHPNLGEFAYICGMIDLNDKI